jgi:signal peptide peptidase SppA
MNVLSRIASRVFGVPLLINEDKAVAILAGLGGRLVEGGIVFPQGIAAIEHVAFENGRPSIGRLGDPLGRRLNARGIFPFDVVDNVAVIPVEGTLVHKGGYIGSSSGETSYQGLQTQVAAAARAHRDGLIKGTVFEVDSFGGEAAGAFETADAIARLSAQMPTLAVLTDSAMSGGYLMASAARAIVMPQFGEAGSIGVLRMHLDLSRKLANEGIKVTLLTAGKHKADGNSFEPLAPAMAQKMIAEAETMRGTFANHVGRYRGARFTAAQALATEAQTYRGAEAQSVGLVDAIGPANEAFDAFISEVNRKG